MLQLAAVSTEAAWCIVRTYTSLAACHEAWRSTNVRVSRKLEVTSEARVGPVGTKGALFLSSHANGRYACQQPRARPQVQLTALGTGRIGALGADFLSARIPTVTSPEQCHGCSARSLCRQPPRILKSRFAQHSLFSHKSTTRQVGRVFSDRQQIAHAHFWTPCKGTASRAPHSLGTEAVFMCGSVAVVTMASSQRRATCSGRVATRDVGAFSPWEGKGTQIIHAR